MTACDSNSYLDYLNKLVEEHINTCHDSISKQPFYAKYSLLPEEIESNNKASKFKVGNRVQITKYKLFLAYVTPKIGQEKYLLLILYWKLILARIKLKIQRKKKNRFYEKEFR